MNFDIHGRHDDIYFDLKKWHGVEKYEEMKSSLTYEGITIGIFINNVNAINKNYGGNLDVVLVDDVELRLYDKETKETVAEYDIVFDLYESTIDYLWKEIK